MNDVQQMLSEMESGDPKNADELLVLVYSELRKLAAVKMAGEDAGQTLDATGLVHEAYLRLVGSGRPQEWNGRGHFFAAAAEAMRRILIENARRKKRLKHGGGRQQVDLEPELLPIATSSDEVLAVNEALDLLEKEDPQSAELVKLRYFAGLTVEEAGQVLGIPARSSYRIWAYARAWLYRELSKSGTQIEI